MTVPSMVLKHAAMLLLVLLQLAVFLATSTSAEPGTAIQPRRPLVLLREKATLLALKRGLTFSSHSALADWNESNPHVCSFTGVTCDERQEHVVELALANLSISGALPPVIGELTHLQKLNMSRNSISGALPSSFYGNLTRLGYLDMSHNLVSGAIPPAIGNLTSLCHLDMSFNLISGQIPVELSNLNNLFGFDLSYNQLHGVIPSSLAMLRQLVYFGLCYNNLSGTIPEAIFINCTSLGYVDVGGNNLSGKIPHKASSTHFLYVNLYSNNLIGTLPRWLANCSSLVNLDVGNNLLADELPTSIISGNKYFKYLRLSNNNLFWSHNGNSNLEPFFVALLNCSSLEEVEAAAVGMGGRLPSWLGSMLPRNLSHLELELNSISGPIPASIGDTIHLTILSLSSNLLNETIPTSLCRMPRLERLALSNNILTGEIPTCINNATRLGDIDLSGNLLSGTIPSTIGSLTGLSYLFLQRNRLSGSIPPSIGPYGNPLVIDLSSNSLSGVVPDEIASTAKITLNLSHNQLVGNLPTGLSSLEQVQLIDLSWNNFTGEILTGLGDCVALTALNLSHNSLAGVLPSSLGRLKNLESLDVSNNYLGGEIPSSLTSCDSLIYLNLSYNNFCGIVPNTGVFKNFSCLSYLGNPRLSGPLVRHCKRRHHSWYQSWKFLIVVCICATAVMILCVAVIRKICKDIFRGRRSIGDSSAWAEYIYPRITYRELVEATEEFSVDRLVGTGSYGRVYRGTLRDGTVVAVKVLQHLQTGNSIKTFNRECQVLRRIRHRNLMRILTVCSQPDFKALVKPFMANGSLERCLYAVPMMELCLMQRVNICSDIAEGMAYLHEHSPVKIIHCDLKPSNVLLNDDMTALVSDFGISQLIASTDDDSGASTTNMLRGSIGYIPPEYGYTSNPTTKGDVYGFGVLVLEMVTRKKPTDDMFEAGLSLNKWVKIHYIHHNHADAVVDPELVRMVQDQSPEVRRMWNLAIAELLELGILCTQEQPSARPTMTDVANDLNRLKQYLGSETRQSP